MLVADMDLFRQVQGCLWSQIISDASSRLQSHLHQGMSFTAASDWRLLPDFFLERVFQLLSWRDRFRASLVCHSWAATFHSPSLWRDLCLLPDNVFLGNSASNVVALDEDVELPVLRRGSVPLLVSRLDYDRVCYRTGLCLRAIGHLVHRICVPATENYYLLHRCLTALASYLEYALRRDYMLQVDNFTFSFHSDWDAEHTYGTGGPLLATLQTVLTLILQATAPTFQRLRITRLLLNLQDAQTFMENIFLKALEQASHQRRDSILWTSDCELLGYYDTQRQSPGSCVSASQLEEATLAMTGLSEHGPPCIGYSSRPRAAPLHLSLGNLTQCVYRPDPLFQMPALWADRLVTLELSPCNISAYFLQELVMHTACEMLLVTQDEYTPTTLECWTEIDPLVWHSLVMLRPQFRVFLRLYLVNVHRADVALQLLDLALPNPVAPVQRICYENSPLRLDMSRALQWTGFAHSLTTLVMHSAPFDWSEGGCDDGLQVLCNSCPLLGELYLACPVCPDSLWALTHFWREPALHTSQYKHSSTWRHFRPMSGGRSPLLCLAVSRRCVRENERHWTLRELLLGTSVPTDEEHILEQEMNAACASMESLERDIRAVLHDPAWRWWGEDEFKRAIAPF